MPSIQGASQQACGQSHNSTINNSKCSCCTKRFSCSKYLCYLLESIHDNSNVDLSEIINNDNFNYEQIINNSNECNDTLKQLILNQFLITNNKIDLLNDKINSLDTKLSSSFESLNTKLDYIISLNPTIPNKLPVINGSTPLCNSDNVTFTLNKNILTNSINNEFTLSLSNTDDCLESYVILNDSNGSYSLVNQSKDPVMLQDVQNDTDMQCMLDASKVVLLSSTKPITDITNKEYEVVPYVANVQDDNATYEVKKNIFGKEVIKEIKNKK